MFLPTNCNFCYTRIVIGNGSIQKLMNKDRERKLVEQAKESINAFSELYDHYLPKIYRYVLNRVGNKEVAEDLTSKIFLKALQNLDRFEYTISFSSWIYRIAHNTVIDFYRTNRKYVVSIESIEYLLKSDSKTERPAEQADLSRKMLSLLKQLPKSYQEVLSLRFFEEQSNEEIAEILDCSTNNVGVKIHRALKAFRKQVKKNHSDLLEFI